MIEKRIENDSFVLFMLLYAHTICLASANISRQ